MRRFSIIITVILLLVVSACSSDKSENGTKNTNENEDKKVVFGQTSWSSTEVPTEIAKQILEEAGYEVDVSLLDQPVIFEALKGKEVDFFMDAWLPYTEAPLWEEYEDVLTKVAESYSDAPLGWAVPSYVEEDSIEDIKQNPEKFNSTVYTIDSGAGVAKIAEEVIEDYNLDMYDLAFSSEGAMIAELDTRINSEEPVIITGWRPHSMFTKYDLKFLDEPKNNYKFDNIYVISYNEIEETHPEAYKILSNWSIDIDDLEEMMYENEINETSFEELAEDWIEENRDKVDDMLNE